MSRVDLLCLTVCFVLAGPLGADDNWPAFRGPTGDGHSTAKGLPLTWSEKENIRWKTPIPGKAWSSPVIWGKQIWMTNAPEDGKQLQAVCVDRDSGKIFRGEVPPYSVLVPGTIEGKPMAGSNLPGPALYCAVIVKRVDAQTRAKTSINELLRD